MPPSKSVYDQPPGAPTPVVREEHIEYGFIGKLQNLKYEYRADIRDRASLERNFREKFEALNRVKLSDGEFARLLDEIVTPDVFTAARINTLTAGEGLSETAIREGYTRFKKEKDSAELAALATQHQLAPAALQTFVDGILQRMIFDGETLSDLMAPLALGWKARAQAELALMKELVPLLTKRAQGRDISGLSAYEQ